MAHGRREDTRTLLRSRFRSKLSCLGAHVWPAADLSSSYRRFEFLPERRPSLVHDQRSALSAEGGEEEDRELGLWAEVGSRGCSRGWWAGGYTSLPGMITQQPLISSCRQSKPRAPHDAGLSRGCLSLRGQSDREAWPISRFRASFKG